MYIAIQQQHVQSTVLEDLKADAYGQPVHQYHNLTVTMLGNFLTMLHALQEMSALSAPIPAFHSSNTEQAVLFVEGSPLSLSSARTPWRHLQHRHPRLSY